MENSERKFDVGDLVFLKSGSPRMTVSSIFGKMVYVHWFNEHQVLESYQFHENELKSAV